MAYLDLDMYDLVAARYSPLAVYSVPKGLNTSELAAVRTARFDTPASLRGTGFFGKLVKFLFGIRMPNRLANLRLERLRRFSVAVAHGRSTLMRRENIRLRALGFSEFQIGEAAAIASQFSQPSWENSQPDAVFRVILS